MSKDYDKYNKFCENYDMYADGIEEEVVEFLKGKFSKAYNAAKKDLMDENGGDEEEMPSPGSLFAHLSNDEEDEFYSSVENWFEKNYPGDELK
jgi:hypothetical protein